MPRIGPVTAENARPNVQRSLDGVAATLGFTPNLFRTFAHSPAVLAAYLGLGRSLKNTTLTAAHRVSIALTVAGINGCDYCASAHTAAGQGAGLDNAELVANLAGASSDGELVEVVLVTAVNIFTNYFNHVAGTEVDFPYVASRPQAAAE